MKTRFTSSLPLIAMFIAILMHCMPLSGQIAFQGLINENEGGAAWNASGSGPEPAGSGYNGSTYYVASRDYVDGSSEYGAHATAVANGFGNFTQALSNLGFSLNQLTIRMGLGSQGDKIPGVDNFNFPGEYYLNFYPLTLTFFLNGEAMISGESNYIIFHNGVSTGNDFHVTCNYFPPVDASGGSSSDVQAAAAAFLQDVGSEELLFTMETFGNTQSMSGNGRTGSYWNLTASIEIGLPKIPMQGLAANHEGFAGWDADGTGPEPKADGHGTQRYYIASREFDEIDPDPGACFTRLLDTGWVGFQNLALQLAYRGFDPDDIRLTMGLRDLDEDILGEDWSSAAGIHTVNFYHSLIMFRLNGEPLFGFVCDTLISYQNIANNYWYGYSALTLLFDASDSSSAPVKAVAAAFFKDLNGKQVQTISNMVTYASGSFSANGRTGGFWQVDDADIIFRHGPGTIIPPGNVSGHWTMAGHPYIITGDITIPDGLSLTIDPGVWVKFTTPSVVKVNGSIQAIGNSSNTGSIVFTAVNPLTGWGQIRFDNTSVLNLPSIFKYCIFEYGSAPPASPVSSPFNSGGAMAIHNYNNVFVNHCEFHHNTALHDGLNPAGGGAIALWNSSPAITNSAFHDNTASIAGAIVCNDGASPAIVNCLFFGNVSQLGNGGGGGAIHCTNSNPAIVNNAFYKNSSNFRGGALEISSKSNPDLINNIFRTNTAPAYPHICIASDSCNVDMHYNILQGGIAATGPHGTGSGNVSNILDIIPGFKDTAALNFSLISGSSCIDAGKPDMTGISMTPDDLAGNFRFWDGGSGSARIDMGPYEFSAPPFTGIGLNPETADMPEVTCYPNPFSNDFSIRYELTTPGDVSITLFNQLGKQVAAIVDGFHSAGVHTVLWQERNLPSGIYYCRFIAANDIRVVSVVKVK